MKKVIAYVHSHWDREWYREFEEFRLRLIEVFDEILELLENNELPYFYFDGQTCALEDYLEIRSEKLPLIKQLIKEKKLRVGPFYCSADSFLSSGECLYRNFEIGIKTAQSLGETDFIGYFCDTFGHSKCIPYILKALNIDKACLWRGLGNLNADLNWDGIKTTYLIQGYFQDFLNYDISIEKKAENLKKYLDKICVKSADNLLLPIGADHLAVAKNLKEQVNKLNNIYKDYKIKISTPFEYFDKVCPSKFRDKPSGCEGNLRVVTSKGELYDGSDEEAAESDTRLNKDCQKVSGEFRDNSLNFILPGVYSSRIYIKQANADIQWLLSRIAEPLQALSSFYFGTKSRQKEIDYAYKTLIKNHAHDSIYGCNIDKVQNDILVRYDNTKSVVDGIIKRVIRDLSDEKGNLSVINLSNFEYSGKVFIETEKKLPKWLNALKISSKKGFTDKKLYNINDIPITEDITDINTYLIDVKNLPAFSLSQLEPENICKIDYLKTGASFIENENIKLEIKNKKIYLTDKLKNKTYKDFITITDRADIGDSYNFGALKNDKSLKAELISYKLQKNNIHRAVLNLTYIVEIPLNSTKKGRTKSKNKCKISINAILYNQSKMVEFKINWINKSKNHILQLCFNLEEKIYSAISEDLFGTVQRNFDPDYNIYKYIPAKRGVELKTNTAPMQRFVNTQNLTVFTKGNNEYEIIKNNLNITLLRATGIISNPKNPTRGTPAGPPLETPELQCIGENSASIAVAFTDNETEMFKLAEEFYNPCISLYTNKQNKIFIEKDNHFLVYAVKEEKNKIITRLFDTYKEKIKNVETKH